MGRWRPTGLPRSCPGAQTPGRRVCAVQKQGVPQQLPGGLRRGRQAERCSLEACAPRTPHDCPQLPTTLCAPCPPRLPSVPPDFDSVPPAPHNGPRLWRLRTEASLSLALGGTLEPGLLPQS